MSKTDPIIKAKYDAANTVRLNLKLNRRTDAPILARLQAVPSMSGYIRQLILEDIKRNAPKFMDAEPLPKSETGQRSLGKSTPRKGEIFYIEKKDDSPC